MRIASGILCTLLVSTLGLCQEPVSTLTIKGETKVAPYKVVRLSLDGLKPKSGYKWKVEALSPDGKVDKERQLKIDWVSGQSLKSKELAFVGWPGDYKITAKAIWVNTEDGSPDWDEIERIVTIISPTPTPVPPGPTPQPPPGPGPTPDPNVAPPIPLPGLRVMIIYDVLKKTQLNANQREIIDTSDEVRMYLRTKTVTTPTNPDGAYRIVDVRQGFQPDEEWYTALKRPRTTLPWLVISNGRTGYEGPLATDMTGKQFIDMVKKYEQ